MAYDKSAEQVELNLNTRGVALQSVEGKATLGDINDTSAYPQDNPAWAVDELILAMPPQRKVLMGIMEYCLEAKSNASVSEEVERLQTYRPSVFTAYDLCALLEEAGGLKRVDSSGADYDASDVEPAIVEEDGVSYYRPDNVPADIYWLTGSAGKTILDDDDPDGRMEQLLKGEKADGFLPMYKTVLTKCREKDGAIQEDLLWYFMHHPKLQSPRIYAPYFLDQLEKCDAIEWTGAWRITEVGERALGLLADEVDTWEPSAEEKAAE